MAGGSLPSAQDAAAALVVAYKSKHQGAGPPSSQAIALPLAQLMSEGSLSRYFEGTNNLGAIHATSRFATVHAGDRGWGMVAFLDHAPGPVAYISRMAVYPSLSNGARAMLDLVEKMVTLESVSSATDYATQLYTHNYFEGMASPATPAAQRPAVAAANGWTDADRQNIAAYAGLITKNLPAASDAVAALPSYTGNPSAVTSGPPFASLADRLTPSSAYAPHTLEHAQALLGAATSSPPSGGVSLADCLATPAGDGVWLFGGQVEPIQPPAPAPAPSSPLSGLLAAAQAHRSAIVGFSIVGVSLAALAAGAAVAPKNWPVLAWEAIAP